MRSRRLWAFTVKSDGQISSAGCPSADGTVSENLWKWKLISLTETPKADCSTKLPGTKPKNGFISRYTTEQ